MTAIIRFKSLKSLCSLTKFANSPSYTEVRPTSILCRNYHTRESNYTRHSKNGFEVLGSKMGTQMVYVRSNSVGAFSPAMSNFQTWNSTAFLVGGTHMITHPFYTSSISSQGNNPKAEVPAASGAGDSDMTDGVIGSSGWIHNVREVWQSVVNATTSAAEKATEAYHEVTPHVQQLLDSHPYLRDVIVPVGGTLLATTFSWFVMPKILRRLHKYSMEGPASLLSGSSLWGPVPYEKSFWGALEDPVRYLITFMACTEIVTMVAPSTFASEYIMPAWRAALIISFIWFLQLWKANVISRALAVKSIRGFERDKLLILDKFSSVGLFVIGLMALAEASGVAVQSILTVGGIGGVATAFAARDVLGNVLSGLAVQISRPFSIGDTIKAGSVEGQVVEMGLTSTSLLSTEKFPVTVPNSLFSSQVIVNKSRAGWHAMDSRIPLHIDDFDKVPQISEDIKMMLRMHANVFLEKEAPYCFLSRIERSHAELTIGCNLKHMRKDELFSAKQDILLQAAQIIKHHGATLGRIEDTNRDTDSAKEQLL